jgi:hypothetical protein
MAGDITASDYADAHDDSFLGAFGLNTPVADSDNAAARSW